MSYAVEFRPAAVSDLDRIHLTIAGASGNERAGLYIDRIEAACVGLTIFPERGTVRDHIHPGLRVIGFERRISIAFIVRPGIVEIVRILPKGMDIAREWVVG